MLKQGKSEGFDSCDLPSNLTQILLKLDSNRRFFARVTLKFDGWPPNNNNARLLYYIKLCVSFQIHQLIQTGVPVRKRPIWVKFNDFFSHVTLQFDVWPWTRQIWGIWKLRPAYSPETPNLGQNRWCFVPCDLEIWWMTLENNRAPLLCCFKLCATFHSQFKLELLSRNAQFGSNSTIFRAVWPWNLTYDLEKQEGTSTMLLQALCIISRPSVNSSWSYSPETPNLGQNRWFFSRVTLQFDVWPWKTIRHLFYATSSFVHHYVAICEFKLELQSGNAQFGSNSTIFRAVWPWNLTDDLEKQ